MTAALQATLPARAASRMQALAVLACLAVPWLWPLAPGPAPNVVPWLLCAVLATCAWVLAGARLPGRAAWVALLALALLLFLRPGSLLDRMALLGAVVLAGLGWQIARGLGAGAAERVAHAWVVAAVGSAVLGLFQYLDLASGLQPWVHAGEPGLAFSNLRQRNQLASLCALGLAALLWLAARPGARWPLLALGALVLGTANAATASRTGLLQWLLLGGLALLASTSEVRRQRLALTGVAFAAYALGTWLLPTLLEHFTGLRAASAVERLDDDLGCSSRGVLWANVLHLIAQRPWAGWGWGELDYAHYATLYPGARFCDVLDNAHNLPLHLAVEGGVPLALGACAWATWAVLRRRPWCELDAGRQLAWSALAILALHSLLEYPLWYGPFQLAAGLALGLLAAPAPARAGPRPLAWTLGALWLSLLAYAGWDYARVSQVYLPPEQRLARWRDDAQAHAERSWLFANQARFARLTLTPVTGANAPWMHGMAEDLLHYSPEPRVIEKAIEAATRLDRFDEAVLHLARYQAAFPQEYSAWHARNAQQPLRLP